MARRSLNVNSALLECNFALPLGAPHSNVEVMNRIDLNQEVMVDTEG